MLQESTQDDIRAHAEACYPRESCGFVVVVKGRERYFACLNAAQTPGEHFVLSAESYARAQDAGEIVGVVHSHPNVPPKPSAADKVMCEASQLPWHIVHVSVPDGAITKVPVATNIHTFEPSGFVMPLVGRPYTYGVFDCFSLVRDYYAREMNIQLPDFERHDDEWWNHGQNLLLDNYEAWGFERIKGAPKPGDVILMQIRSPVANHNAVYIGNGLILHHICNRLSSRDVYNGYFQEVTRFIIRHKDAPK
jgi:proteasome lid subunit RPN8/RPN11